MSTFSDAAKNLTATSKPIGDGRFGAQLATFENGIKGVLKVARNSKKLFRGVPEREFHLREVAAYRLDRDLIKFGIIPETVRVKWKGQDASLQKFVEGVHARALVPDVFNRKHEDWKERVIKFSKLVNLTALRRIALFDLVVNSVDRHLRNVVIDTHNNTAWGTDNSLICPVRNALFGLHKSTFHTYLFFNALPVPPEDLKRLDALKLGDFMECLTPFLPARQVEETYWRCRFVVEHSDRLAFSRLSPKGAHSSVFPTYEKWYAKKKAPKDDDLTAVLEPGLL